MPNLPPPIYHCKRTLTPPAFKGNLHDEIWQKADDIYLKNVISGEPVRFKTIVKALYDDDHLYIGFECEDDYIWGMDAASGLVFNENCVEVFLNPAGHNHQYYEIDINPKNCQFASCILNYRDQHNPDKKFVGLQGWPNPSIKTVATIEGKADIIGEGKKWTVEYAIPFSLIPEAGGKAPEPASVWRANFYRIDAPALPTLPIDQVVQEHYAWSPTGKIDFHRPWHFGKLKFV